MSATVFEVPVVFQDLPRRETYAQLCDSLTILAQATDDLFARLDQRIDAERGNSSDSDWFHKHEARNTHTCPNYAVVGDALHYL